MQTVLDIVDRQAETRHFTDGRDLLHVRLVSPGEGGFPILSTVWSDERDSPDRSGETLIEALPARASLEELEEEALDAGWGLGAWDVERLEVGPPALAGQQGAADQTIRGMIGSGPYLVGAGSSEAAELDSEGVIVQLVGLSMQHGAVYWHLSPNAYNPSRRAVNGDRTLSVDGSRPPRDTKWGRLQPLGARTNHATMYQLGED